MIAKIIASLLTSLAKFFAFFQWGRDRERRKRLEETLERVKERDRLEKEIRNEADADLVDRLSGND